MLYNYLPFIVIVHLHCVLFRHVKGRVLVALANGKVAIFHRALGKINLSIKKANELKSHKCWKEILYDE